MLPILAILSCSKYDDTELWNKIKDHDARISKLEQLCAQCNTNIVSIQKILEALQEKDTISSVTPIYEGTNIIGYTITFSKSSPITIYNGKDGKDGKDGISPTIGAKQDTDGIWYWTINGEWLLSSGHKIQANGNNGVNGKNGITPQLKITDNYWYISYDNGKTWEKLGKATGEDGKDGTDGKEGDSFFKNVWQDDSNVHFQLADGTIITLPLSSSEQKLSIHLDADNIPVMNAGETKCVKYTISNPTPKTIVKAISQNGWIAIVKSNGTESGEIIIQAPNPIVDSEILVFASNGEGQTVMAVLNCAKGECTVAKDCYEIDYKGGNINLVVSTNIPFSITIPDNAKDWVYDVSTKATTVETRTLSIRENTENGERYANIVLVDENSQELTHVMILQDGAPFSGDANISVSQAGQLKNAMSSYDIKSIKSLSISGPLNNDDYSFIKDELVSLKRLDLSSASGIEPNFQNHKYTIDLIILPNSLKAISPYAFADSYVVKVVLPNNLESIGDYAFLNCSRMTGAIIIPKTLSYLGNYAFDGTAIEEFIFENNPSIIKFTDNCLPPTIKSLRIPKSIVELEKSSFENLTSLESLSFEENSQITTIPSLCFAGLPLKEVKFPISLQKIEGISNGDKKTYNIHGTSCYGGAFEKCSLLSSIDIPQMVSSIEPGAFHESGIKKLTFAQGSALTKLEGWSIDGITSGPRIGAFSNTKIESITIPACITEIQDASFADCSFLREILFEAGSHLEVINGMNPRPGYYSYISGAFCNCTALQSIIIPSSVKTIKGGAFYGCSSLVSLSFEKGSHLEKLEGTLYSPGDFTVACGAFECCTSLKKVSIPASVKEITSAAFNGCKSLSDISFEEDSQCTTISGHIDIEYYQDCYGPFAETAITSLSLPASITTIDQGAFYKAQSLANIKFGGNHSVEINSYAFCYCKQLSSIDASKGCIIPQKHAFISEYGYSKSSKSFYRTEFCPINVVKIGSIRPPLCASDAFGDVSKATLYVPTDAINEYSLSSGWGNFGSIKSL